MFEQAELFGREKEHEIFTESIQKKTIVIIEGICGIGKSSFVYSVSSQVPLQPYYIKIGVKDSFQELMNHISCTGLQTLPDSCGIIHQIRGVVSSGKNSILYIDDFHHLDQECAKILLKEASMARILKIVCITSEKLKIPPGCVDEVFLMTLDTLKSKDAEKFLTHLSRIHDISIDLSVYRQILQMTGKNPYHMKLFFAALLESNIMTVTEYSQIEKIMYANETVIHWFPEKIVPLIQYLACFREPFILVSALKMVECSDKRKEILGKLLLKRIFQEGFRYLVHESYGYIIFRTMSKNTRCRNNYLAAQYYKKYEPENIKEILYHLTEAEEYDEAEYIAALSGVYIKKFLNAPGEYLQIFEKMMSVTKSETASVYAAVIHAYSGNYHVAEKIAETWNGSEKWQHAEILNIKGLCAYRNGQYKKSIDFFRQACREAAEYQKQRIQYNLGTVFYESGEEEKGTKIFKELLNYYLKSGDNYWIAQCDNALAVQYYLKCDYIQAIKYYNDAIYYLERDKNEFMKSRVLSNLALIYCSQGDFGRGADLLRKSLHIEKKYGYERGIISTLNNLSSVFFDTKEFKKGWDALKESMARAETSGDEMACAECLSYSGRGYELQKNYKKAREFYEKALKIYQKNNSLYHCASELAALGCIDSHEQDFKNSRKKLLESLKIARKIGITGRMADIYISLSENEIRKKQNSISDFSKKSLCRLKRYLEYAVCQAESISYTDGLCRALSLKQSVGLGKENEIMQLNLLFNTMSGFKKEQIQYWKAQFSLKNYMHLFYENNKTVFSDSENSSSIGEYYFNFAEGNGRWKNETIDKVFQRPLLCNLLLYLVKNTAQECGLSDIYESVWGMPYTADNTATVRMAVSRLRKALGPAEKYLETRGKNAYAFFPPNGFCAVWNQE